jgi:hypothetical protein
VTGGSAADKAGVAAPEQTQRVADAATKVDGASTVATDHLTAAVSGIGTLTHAGVLELQRTVGNRSTLALIQREPEAAVKAGAKKGWGALKGVVDESRAFNKPGRKQSGPLVMDDQIEAELGPERAEQFKKLMSDREARQKKTTTAGGAFLASQVNSKEKIGSSAAYISPEERDDHLGEFLKGAHAFVSNDAYLKIRGEHLTEKNFNAWGSDSNFVAPLSDADKLVEEAAAEGGRGLFLLEERLGIPKNSWVNQCKSSGYGIWRFKILKPEALNIRIPSGGEYGAYGSWVDREGAAHRGEWRPGGQTLGGAREAVIDKIGTGKFGESGEKAGEDVRNKLAQLVQDGVLEIVLDKSMAANTQRVIDETSAPAPAPAPS